MGADSTELPAPASLEGRRLFFLFFFFFFFLFFFINLAVFTAIAMTDTNTNPSSLQRAAWLRKLYFTRAAFSFAWVALAFTVAKGSPVVATALLVVYPAWDALANLWDARMTGGAKANPTQVLNAWMSALVTVAVAVSLGLHLQIIWRSSGCGRSWRGCCSWRRRFVGARAIGGSG
jgi:hypothetical protein